MILTDTSICMPQYVNTIKRMVIGILLFLPTNSLGMVRIYMFDF